MDFLRQPFFDEIREAKTILLAGAGGGYDIYSGVPLYVGLRAAGKTVHLANLSFTSLCNTDAREVGDSLFEVTHQTNGPGYFPEVHLCRWIKETRGENTSIYGIAQTGVAPIRRAYRNLAEVLGNIDAVILIDGGTDSLMRGDEAGLGTPEEDIASLCAVNELESISTKLLVCIGFGVDTYHGVCHAHFLEAVAELARQGAYLGTWSLTADMPEAAAYREAVAWVHREMPQHPSIVSSSIVSAVEGKFGDYQATSRTEGSRLFINPLMSLYWAFRLGPVAARNLYLENVQNAESYAQLSTEIKLFRHRIQERIRRWEDLPM